MNRAILQKHLEGAYTYENPVLAVDGSNAQLFFCADIVGAKRFAQNYGGYPRSEIAQINEAATMEEQLNLMNSLRDYSPSDNPNAGKTDAEIMLGHKSKYLQAASEKIAWLEGQLERRDNERWAAVEKAKAEEHVETPKVEQSVDAE